MPEESITATATSDNSFTLKFTYCHNSKIGAKFERDYLKQDKAS